MSPAILLTLALVSAAPRTLASPGLTSINIDERVAAFYSEFFAQELAVKSGFRVVTQAEVATLLGLERQRQLLGCSDDSTSCMAELAGALGAEGVVTGSIARLGSGFAITLKVISPQDARTLAVRTGRSKDEDALLDWLTETAGIVGRQLKGAFAPASDAGAVAASEPEVPIFPGNPRRIARNGKLFTELETAKYFVAKQRGLSETDAILEAKGLPPERAVSPGVSPPRDAGVAQPAPDAGPPAPFVPAPLPRRVARGGKVLSDAQTKRYYEARAGGRSEAEAFAFALTTPVEAAPLPVALPTAAPPLLLPALDGGARTLPAGLPRRIARDGKLLSEEETERYFREKFKVP